MLRLYLRVIDLLSCVGPAAAMPSHRVMIVDEEVLVRQGLSARLSRPGEIEVAGVTSSARLAMTKLESTPVDALVVDWNFDAEDPSDELKLLRQKFPDLLIISIVPTDFFIRRLPSELLQIGRSEAIVRPRQESTPEALLDEMARLINRRLTQMFASFERSKSLGQTQIAPESKSGFFRPAPEAGSPLPGPASVKPEPPQAKPGQRPYESDTAELTARIAARAPKRVDVIAIASSTGGPNALAELLPALPADLPVPVVIVQHMPAEFTKSLAERLDSICSITVREGASGDRLKPGVALLAPGDRHMMVELTIDKQVVVTLNQGPPENSCRPAADVLFRSVARIYGEHALAVVLTGMGKDGLAGARVIHESGGRILAQDEASSVVWGMPGEIAQAKLADAIVPLGEMASEMIRRTRTGRNN